MASIRKKGELQWHVQIRKKGFQPITKTFTTRATAQAWAKVVESEMVRGVFTDRAEAESTTLRTAFERYMREISPSKKGYKKEIVRLKWWMNEPIASRTLAAVTSSDLARWRDDRLKTVKPATVQRDLSSLSHLFTICNKEWGGFRNQSGTQHT